ncbi:hypothetical protein [Mucilaginibacter lacusdianchii]|uniref:hypothetical protein n=1 Tax=Mucilaginibacter lacusdianchii TaxID=2684211 RepID=UPI00131E39FB|nr:hypothetical protein [Mucilaginibacter sp. JXJ CY 39]
MKIVPIVRKAKLKDLDQEMEDIQYWLSRPPYERMAAVTRLIAMHLQPGQRMDKMFVTRRKLHS